MKLASVFVTGVFFCIVWLAGFRLGTAASNAVTITAIVLSSIFVGRAFHNDTDLRLLMPVVLWVSFMLAAVAGQHWLRHRFTADVVTTGSAAIASVMLAGLAFVDHRARLKQADSAGLTDHAEDSA